MATGKLTNIGQHDWIAVSLTANQAYEFTIVGALAEIGTADALSGDGLAAFSIAASSVGISPAGTPIHVLHAVSQRHLLHRRFRQFRLGAGKPNDPRLGGGRRLHRQSHSSGSITVGAPRLTAPAFSPALPSPTPAPPGMRDRR